MQRETMQLLPDPVLMQKDVILLLHPIVSTSKENIMSGIPRENMPL